MTDFLKNRKEEEITELDVRPILDAGKDPLKQLLAALKSLPHGHVLRLLNTFEPSPLIVLVEKKGFVSYVKAEKTDLIVTYLYKKPEAQEVDVELPDSEEGEDFVRFKDRSIELDVRDLPMPQPMMSILEALENLPQGQALFVQHKKVPVFLLPELRERGFSYRIKEIEDHHVQLLIFKDEE